MKRHTKILIFLMVLFTSAVSSQQTTDLNKNNGVFQDFSRDRYDIVTILTDQYTCFFGDRPGEFGFEDLAIGDWVTVDGIIIDDLVFLAQFVHLDHHPPNDNPNHTQDPNEAHVCGTIESITPETLTFTVFRSGYQNQFILVDAPPDIPIKDAPIGQPLVDIAFEDLFEGNPVMINGELEMGRMIASIIVRSNDWQPPGGSNSTTYDLYGTINRVMFHDGHKLIIWIDTMTGDPNHHTYNYDVGPEGGMLNFPWGYLLVPPGALDQLQRITVDGDFMFTWTLRNVYSFAPQMEFEIPITMELRYFNLGAIDPDRVVLQYFNEETETWEYAGEMEHHPESHCFRGPISHFSRYSLSVNGRPLEQAIQEH